MIKYLKNQILMKLKVRNKEKNDPANVTCHWGLDFYHSFFTPQQRRPLLDDL